MSLAVHFWLWHLEMCMNREVFFPGDGNGWAGDQA